MPGQRHVRRARQAPTACCGPRAFGAGNLLVLIGNRTGRDGIGGASVLASAELSDDDADKRPSVQVSDPFTERKLMDCCLELAAGGLLLALQDLGAAGLTSAASEMAAKGGVGLDIDLDRVHLREEGMAPAEILVSESQERMLGLVAPARLDGGAGHLCALGARCQRDRRRDDDRELHGPSTTARSWSTSRPRR